METNWEKSVIEKVLLETVQEQRRARRWRIFFRFIWLILIIWLLIYSFWDSHEKSKHVALVNLKGVISYEANTYSALIDGITEALKDNNTVGIIIRANSPGGSPVYSNMVYSEILRLRRLHPNIPIEVVVEEVCASGCYYIATAADKIYANPASIVGSIGVIYPSFGLTGLMQKLGIDSRLLTAGKNKAMGYPFSPINKEHQLIQQNMLNQIHHQFIDAVKQGRGKRLMKDPDLFSGRYWIGEDAAKLGLIDGFATVDSLARDQFKLDNIVDYTPQQDPLEKISKKFGMSLVNWTRQLITTIELGNYN